MRACVFVCVCVHVCVCVCGGGGGGWLRAVVRTCVVICVVVLLRGIWFQIAQALPDVFSHQRHCDEARGAQMIFTEEKAASEKYENLFSCRLQLEFCLYFQLFRIVLIS